jgi:uncharacterized membrane protein
MVAGTSAIVSLKEADHEDKVLLAQNMAMLGSFTSASGAAPGTLIGVIAKYRDLFKNTDGAVKNLATYNANPVGLSRPTFSEELTAMMPIVKKEMPLFMIANSAKDIHRAINLQKDYGFKMILADVKQSQNTLPMVKAGGFPLLLSLDLPEEIKEEKPDTSKTEKKEVKKEMTAEEKSLNERKKASYDTYLKQASEIEKMGIPFSFSYADTKIGDIHKSIRRYVKSGLSESAALAALTTTPANMLGMSKVAGTIEQGKAANIVLTSKPLFDEKSEIKYVIIEGSISDYNEKKKPSDGKVDPKGVDIAGEWSFSVETPGGKQSGKIIFEKDGSGYKGSSTSDNDSSQKNELKNISVEGNKVKFDMDINMGQPITLGFDLEIAGDSFTGQVSVGPMGTFPISGNRISGPKF